MAIYRTGQASMDADGFITGYGTKWKTALTLIRTGATIVFASNPVEYATISEIVNDTSLRAITTSGRSIPRGDYVILLHDSLTVDGLAQDVAETLRYYQGQETMYQGFVEFLKTFDWKKLEQIGNQVHTDAAAADASAKAAKASQTAAAASASNAEGSEIAARASEEAAEASENAAAASQRAAAASQSAASASQQAAKTSETNSKASENAAAASKNAAAASQTAAKTSETNAGNSARAAAASQTAARTSETNAATSATKAAESQAAAAASQKAASGSATTAQQQADRAKAEADRAQTANPDNQLKKANNLSDVADKPTSRNNLGVGERQTVKFGTVQLESSASNPLLLKSVNPCVRFEETDPVTGKPTAYMLVMDGGNIRMQENDTGTGDEVFSYDSSNNTFKLPRALFRDIAGTRKGLSLDVTDTATFSQLRAPNGLICTTESNSTNDNPSAPIVTQLRAADKATIVSQGEFRADRNGNVSIINRAGASANSPQFATLAQNGDFTVPNLVSQRGCEVPNIEVGYRNKNSTAYIDLHYSGKYDYDARIYCDGMNRDANGGGNLRFTAGYMNANIAGGYLFNGGRFTIETSDINLRTKLYTSWDADSFVIRPRTAGNSHYIMFNDLNKNTGWVGNPSNNDDSIGLWSYVHNKGVQISDRIRLNGGDTNCQGNLFVDGSSAYVRGGDGNSNTHFWLQNRAGRNRAVIYSNDTQVLQLRSDNAATGAGGQALSIYGATGECKAAKFTATSDERAKFWMKPVTGALDKICQLRGMTYSMHTTLQNTVRNAGIIAQDVQKVLPEAVTVTEGNDHAVLNKNCDKVENPLSLDYNALSALYVEAFKELKAENESLRAEIESMKAAIAQMQTMFTQLAK